MAILFIGTILAILVGSHLGNISVKFDWPNGLGGDVFLPTFFFKANYSHFTI